MPEVSLQRASIDAVIGELEATGVAQHVRVHWKPNPAATPSRAIILRKPAGVNGAPRSDVKINGDAGSWSRLSRRNARNSRPDNG